MITAPQYEALLVEWQNHDTDSPLHRPPPNSTIHTPPTLIDVTEMVMNTIFSQECISILRCGSRNDIKTANMYVERVWETDFVGGDEKKGIMREMHMKVFKEGYRVYDGKKKKR